MYNPILEKRKELIDNIQKSFGDDDINIEKAKWQIGEIRVDSRGIAHECYEYTSDGKPRLRRVKKNKGLAASTDSGKKQMLREEFVEKMRKNGVSEEEIKRFLDFEKFGDSIAEQIKTGKKRKERLNDIISKEKQPKKEEKKEDLNQVGEFKNGFKFKKNTEYVLRYNKHEKQYEVFENKTQRGFGKVPMWVCKSDNGDEKFGEKILKVVQKKYSREGSTILFRNITYSL